MKSKKRVKEHWNYVVMVDGWIPDKQFEKGQEEQRDSYIDHCNENYQGRHIWVRQKNQNVVRHVCKAVGF